MNKKFLFAWLAFISSPICAAPRINQGQVCVTRSQGLEKLPADVRDSLLLANGINAITNVAQILLDPHDIPGVKNHLAGALGALGAFVQALIRSPRRGKLQDYIHEMTDEEVKTVVDHLLKIFHMPR